jgi:hypothetical protein
MHDVNPLGVTMHLRDLERQASPKLKPLDLGKASALQAAGAATLSFWLILYPAAILQAVAGILRR